MSNEIKSGILTKNGQEYFPVTHVSLVEGLEDINDIRTGAIAGATAYQKPQTGIPANDLASGVIPAPEVFIAEYDVTTLAELVTAYNAGKALFVDKNHARYSLSNILIDNNAIIGFMFTVSLVEYGPTIIELIIDENGWNVNEMIDVPDSLYQLSDDSTHRLVTDTEKATWNGKYTKPASGIPASDLESGVIPSYSIADANNLGLVRVDKNAGGISKDSNGKLILDTASDAEIAAKTTVCALKVRQIDKAVKEGVTNNSITLTSAEQTAAKSWLGVNDTPEIFWATYGTTTRQEIMDAVDDGKAVFVKYGQRIYTAAHINTTAGNTENFFFSCMDNGNLQSLLLDSSNSWVGPMGAVAENTNNKVSTISGNETNTSKYPNTKATYDAIHPAIETTQPSGGFLPNIVYDLGTLSGNITFALAAPADANVVNHYYWTFDTGSTAPTITWPTGLTWMGGSAPTINASKHYEISVLNNIGTFMEV